MSTRYLIILVAASLLQGCGLWIFTPSEEKAVVDEHIYDTLEPSVGVNALSTKLERRLVLMERYKKKHGEYKHGEYEHGEYKLKVCAESPAEATQDLSSTFDFAGTVEKVEISKLLKALSTKVKPTFKRSQGLQFYRDGAFQLCQAYLNGLITGGYSYHDFHSCPHCFIEELNALRDTAANIILHEVANGFYPGSDDEAEKTEMERTTETTSKTTHKSVAKEEKEEKKK